MSQASAFFKPQQYQEIVIHLENINELFTIPTPDPFSAHVRFVPGIESIQAELRTGILHQGKNVRATIFLPKNRLEPDMATRTQEAIQRYSLFKNTENHQAITPLRKEALQALLIGILFLTSGLLFHTYIEKNLALPSFVSVLFEDGFTIAFWVILWRPVDFFLFDALSFLKNKRINTLLMTMEVVIKEQ